MKVWIPILAILGGICGLTSGAFVGIAGSAFGEDEMANSGGWIFFLSCLPFALGFTAWKWSKFSGWALIAIALIGLWNNGLFFILAALFLLIAGIMALRFKKQTSTKVSL